MPQDAAKAYVMPAGAAKAYVMPGNAAKAYAMPAERVTRRSQSMPCRGQLNSRGI
jgi:hypothetical protein